MASTDARPVPRKNAAFRLQLALRNASNDLVTGWSGASAAAEISKDGGNYAAATNAPTEIQTSGTGYLDLTATEMNADGLLVKITATGAKDLVIALYPEEEGDYRVDKTGYALSASGVDAILDEALAGHASAGTLGKAVSDLLVDTAAILDDTGTSGVVIATASKDGMILDATAIDTIDVADGINAREALNLILAALAGEVSGAGTNTITIKDAGDDAATRVVAAVDGQGNRTSVTLTLPS